MHKFAFFLLGVALFTIAQPMLFAPLCAQTPTTNPPAIPHRLTLADAERILLERNLSVIAAKYQIEASRAARLIAAYKPNPVVTVGAEQLRLGNHFFNNLVKPDANLAALSTYTFRIDKTIERGGKRELRAEQADYQVKVNEELMLDAVRQQLFQLRQAFNQANLARENLVLAEATQQQYEQTEKLTAVKVENGDLPGVEVYRARAGRLQYEQAVLQARTTYNQATRDVLNLLGARPDDVAPAGQTAQRATEPSNESATDVAAGLAHGPQLVPISFTSATDPAVTNSAAPVVPASITDAPLEIVAAFDDRPIAQAPDELRRMALAERPDVIAARYLVDVAGRGAALAAAQRVRDVSVGVAYQRVGQDSSVGGTISLPLFLYNNGRAAIAQAEAQRHASEALLRQAELQATTDVEKAYQSYLSARRSLDLYGAQNLKQLERLRSVAALSYKEGASSLFELLDAQRTYNAALSAFNQARADYQLALWQLEQATGRVLR